MSHRTFAACLVAIAGLFSGFFFLEVIPGLLPLDLDDIARKALLDGYVNPTATGYTSDTLACGVVLLAWVVHERSALGVRHGWIAVLLSFVPGVAVGFAAYLLLRSRSLGPAGERAVPGSSRAGAAPR